MAIRLSVLALTALSFLFPALAAAAPAASPAGSYASFETDATSGVPTRIRAAIDGYAKLDAGNPEVAWRLIRAYFAYYDELAERNQEKERVWAADAGYELANQAIKEHPEHPEVVYYAGLIGMAYLDMHQMKALFIVGEVMDRFRKARALKPALDDWGPDRSLGILYHSLPGWPLSQGDRKKAHEHLQRAADNAPERGINRLMLAQVLLALDEPAAAKPHLEFLQKGNWRASSPHWRAITERRIGETVKQWEAADR